MIMEQVYTRNKAGNYENQEMGEVTNTGIFATLRGKVCVVKTSEHWLGEQAIRCEIVYEHEHGERVGEILNAKGYEGCGLAYCHYVCLSSLQPSEQFNWLVEVLVP